MSGVDLQAIYNRLNSVPRYHPMSADTYADWAMEAGDIVTVSRGGTSYQSPVGTSTLKWNGKHRIQIESEGNRERDAISRISARKYAKGGGGGGGMRGTQELYWEMFSEDGVMHSTIEATASRIETFVENTVSGLYSRITQTDTYLRSVLADTANGLYSRIEQTASSLQSEIEDTACGLYSRITQTASSLQSEIADTANGLSSRIEQNASQIALRVAKGDVGTQLAVELGNVTVSGGNLVVDGYIKTSELNASYINSLFSGSQVLSTNYAYIRNLECSSFTQGEYTMDVSDAVSNVKIELSSGNTYTLYKKHFYTSDWVSAGNFSRAVTSVSWSWSGGMAKAVLSPQDQTFYSKQIDAIQPHGQATWDSDGKGFTVTLDVDDTDGTTVFSDEMHFDTSASYNQGYSAVKGTYTTSGGVLKVSKSSSGASFPMSFSIDAGITYDSSTHKYTAKALCDDTLMDSVESGTEAYLAGVTDGEGHFRLTSVTLQGTAYGDITPIGTAHKFTYTHLYTAGTAATYYNAGSSVTYYQGNGSSVTGRGDSVSVTPIGTAHKLKYTKLYKTRSATAEVQWAYVADSSGSTTWYSAGSATTYYKGNGSSVTGRGSTVTVTKQGSSVSVTPIGSTQWAYVGDSNGSTVYYDKGTTVSGLRRAGTTDITSYYTKTS